MCDDDYCYGYGNDYMNGVGFGILIAIGIIAAPALPIAAGGWYIGAEVIGNNFAKWGLAGTVN